MILLNSTAAGIHAKNSHAAAHVGAFHCADTVFTWVSTENLFCHSLSPLTSRWLCLVLIHGDVMLFQRNVIFYGVTVVCAVLCSICTKCETTCWSITKMLLDALLIESVCNGIRRIRSNYIDTTLKLFEFGNQVRLLTACRKMSGHCACVWILST